MVLRVIDGGRRFKAIPFLDIQPSPSPWLVKHVLPTQGVGFIVGSPKAGKSFFAIDIAMRIATGMSVLGKRTKRRGVIYCPAEDDWGCAARIAAWRKKNGCDGSWRPLHFFVEEFNLLDRGFVNDLAESFLDSAEAFAENEDELGLIVFDTLNACTPGADEDKSPSMGLALAALKYISRRTGALVLVVAHFGKAGEERGIRGWSGMDAASDATLHVERDDIDKDLRTVRLSKVKNAPDGAETSFRLVDVPLCMKDEDGDEMSSCVCEFVSAPQARPKGRPKTLTAPQQLTLEAIRYLHDNGPNQPMPAAIGALPWQRAILRTELAKRLGETAFAYDGEKPDAMRMRLNRAIEGLAAAHRIRAEKELCWLV